jgi:hypothetical protein
LFHKIAVEAFTTFASELSVTGLGSLTEVLDTEESLEGQKRLFAQDVDDVEEGENDGDEESASDVEMVDGPTSETDGSEADGSEEDSSSGDGSSEEESDDEELIQFNNMLAMTLQTTKPSTNGQESEDTSDDSDMDDEQMMALDPQLTKIFKQRSQITGKREREHAKQNMVQFKSRVLDLLAVFLDKQYSNPLSLQALLPVLRLTRASANKQLSDKSSQLLKAAVPVPDDVDAAWEVLKGIHEEAKMGGGASIHANACSSASLHLAKVLVGVDKENYGEVLDVYAETQKQWFADRKSSLQSTLFTQFLNWSTQLRSGK